MHNLLKIEFKIAVRNRQTPEWSGILKEKERRIDIFYLSMLYMAVEGIYVVAIHNPHIHISDTKVFVIL
jgi:hypothetical protein